MIHINFSVILLLFLLTFQTSLGHRSIYKCLKFRTSVCRLQNLNLTSETKDFTIDPNGLDVSGITKSDINKSKVQVLTSAVCQTFPKLLEYYAQDIRLTSIEANTFENCKMLTGVALAFNNLTTLPEGLFDHNKNLEVIFLSNNKLKTLDGNLFKNNVKLDIIYLDRNQLTTIPSNLFENNPALTDLDLRNNSLKEFVIGNELPRLKWLYLSLNKLVDIEIEKVLKQFPELQELWMFDNDFDCDRRLEIIKVLEEKRTLSWRFYKCGEEPKSLVITEPSSGDITALSSLIKAFSIVIFSYYLEKLF